MVYVDRVVKYKPQVVEVVKTKEVQAEKPASAKDEKPKKNKGGEEK